MAPDFFPSRSCVTSNTLPLPSGMATPRKWPFSPRERESWVELQILWDGIMNVLNKSFQIVRFPTLQQNAWGHQVQRRKWFRLFSIGVTSLWSTDPVHQGPWRGSPLGESWQLTPWKQSKNKKREKAGISRSPWKAQPQWSKDLSSGPALKVLPALAILETKLSATHGPFRDIQHPKYSRDRGLFVLFYFYHVPLELMATGMSLCLLAFHLNGKEKERQAAVTTL